MPSRSAQKGISIPLKTHYGHDLHKKISDMVVTRCMAIAILKRDRASFPEAQRRSEALEKKLTFKEKDKVPHVEEGSTDDMLHEFVNEVMERVWDGVGDADIPDEQDSDDDEIYNTEDRDDDSSGEDGIIEVN
ncbi:MAG: hypothetical protein SGPRY_002970 [Prymnesium sp.]